MEINTSWIIFFTAFFFSLFDNQSFFQNVIQTYPLSSQNIAFLISLAIGITAITVFFFTIVTTRYTTKAVLISFTILSSLAAYFMDNYNVVIDHIMIQNMMETNWAETSDLFSTKMLLYLLLLGVLPSFCIYKVKIKPVPFKKSIVYKCRDIILSLLFLFGMVLFFSKFYTSFFREHKPLRYYANPSYYIYSLGKYLGRTSRLNDIPIIPIGLDAKVVETGSDGKDEHTELVILVVGEAARADHFSLNGYTRKTNPLLGQENIFNFSDMYSCGTSTAYSVPCMFSIFPKNKYSPAKGIANENILDVLSHTGFIDILWRDNNSDSKGVALRVPYEDYSNPELNSVCSDGECRDEGMLKGLDQYISQHKGRDILIILHQMGNHGPAYYKRYPKEFEQFKPICATNQLEECSKEEITNAYDNALLYTDYFLSKTINLLKKYDTTHATAMIYLSDHGESLGEKNIYLHGMPYMIAPESQTHIGALMWIGSEISKEINLTRIRQNTDKRYSHDNLFHTLLGIFEVESEVYVKEMDILKNINEENPRKNYTPQYGMSVKT